MLYFYDTCALLNLQERAFESPFIISPETLRELEEIKTSSRKDADVKYKARNITRLLIEDKECFKTYDVKAHKDMSGDERIRADAQVAQFIMHEPVTFVTDDLLCRLMVDDSKFSAVIGSESLIENDEWYPGYRVLECDDAALAEFYENMTENTAQCALNEYVVLRQCGEDVDVYKWCKDGYHVLFNKPLRSTYLGETKPKDILQRAAVDSIMTNMITCIAGPAGSGKSLLSLASALHLLKTGKYDRIVMLVNPTKAYGAEDMGFYPGTSYEKLMANFAGNMLSTKLGDQCGVDQMVDQGKLRIISMADVRGMEIRDNEILYISEAQNTTIDLMKLCLSRVSDGAKVILEGDYMTQVDSWAYRDQRNGMKRAIEVLRGSPLFGYVELQKIWRSPLTELVEKM